MVRALTRMEGGKCTERQREPTTQTDIIIKGQPPKGQPTKKKSERDLMQNLKDQVKLTRNWEDHKGSWIGDLRKRKNTPGRKIRESREEKTGNRWS